MTDDALQASKAAAAYHAMQSVTALTGHCSRCLRVSRSADVIRCQYTHSHTGDSHSLVADIFEEKSRGAILERCYGTRRLARLSSILKLYTACICADAIYVSARQLYNTTVV